MLTLQVMPDMAVAIHVARGVYLGAFKGPHGEEVLLAVRSDGRIVPEGPVYVTTPAQLASEYQRLWGVLELIDRAHGTLGGHLQHRADESAIEALVSETTAGVGA